MVKQLILLLLEIQGGRNETYFRIYHIGLMTHLYPRKELEKNLKRGKYPKACYALDKQKIYILCKWVKSKFPNSYISNIGRYVDLQKHKLFNMKSHDYHVFMQGLLPIAFREFLLNKV